MARDAIDELIIDPWVPLRFHKRLLHRSVYRFSRPKRTSLAGDAIDHETPVASTAAIHPRLVHAEAAASEHGEVGLKVCEEIARKRHVVHLLRRRLGAAGPVQCGVV